MFETVKPKHSMYAFRIEINYYMTLQGIWQSIRFNLTITLCRICRNSKFTTIRTYNLTICRFNNIY